MSPPVVLVTTTSDVASDSRAPLVWLETAYTDALQASGVIPLILPPMTPEAAVAALDRVNGLVLTGGEDIDAHLFGEPPHPANGVPHRCRDECEIALARAARERRMPTLAICRGAQVVNVACGGSLIQDISALHPRGRERVHDVRIDADSPLASIVGDARITVNGRHHQAIGRVADGLRVVGNAPDGVIEAIETVDSDWWMVGVQWHAEELTGTTEAWDRRLFEAFARAVRLS